MKNWIVAILILSLIGLGYVQYRLLITGLQLQKTTLDKKVEQVLRATKKQLHEPFEISKNIDLLVSIGNGFTSDEIDSLKEKSLTKLQYLLEKKFEEKDVYGVDFSFYISSPGRQDIALGNTKNELLKGSHYQQPLSGAIAQNCHCQLVLELQVQNLFAYLLKQLQTLLFSSLLFLIVIVFCFVWFLRMLNKERKLARIKNDFINNLAHEFKTPVFSIALATKMLEQYLKTNYSPKPVEYLKLIRQENEKVGGHIDKILELASLEEGQYIMDKEEVEINAFLRKMILPFQDKVEKNNGELEITLLNDAEIISLDKTHFSNALLNLLENALKYRKADFLKMKLLVKKEKGNIIISVQDNGKGIAKEDQKQIFKKFYRVNNGNVHDIKGFGLGLSYVKQVVGRHNGKMRVESELGMGSIFSIELSLKKMKK